MTPSRKADLLCVGGAKAVAGIAMLVLHLLVMRELAPGDYGLFGLGLTCLVVLEGFAGSALDMGVLRDAPQWHQPGCYGFSPLERTALLMKALLCAAMCGGVIALVPWFAPGLFRDVNTDGIVAAVSAGAAGILMLRSLLVNFQVSQCPRRFGMADLSHTVLRLLLVWGIGEAGFRSPAALLAAYGAASWIVFAVVSPFVLRASAPAPWFDAGKFRRLAVYGGSVLVAGGLSTAITTMDMFALGLRSTTEEAGFYRAALTVAMIPEFAGSCLGQAFAGRIATDSASPRFAWFFTRLHLLLLLTCGVLWSGAVLLLPFVSDLIPAAYGKSITVVQVLLPAGLAGLFAFPLLVNFLAFYSLRTIVVLDCSLLPLLLIGYHLAAPHGAVAVAFITSAARLAKAGGLYFAASRLVTRDRTCDTPLSPELRPVTAQEEAHA